VSEIEKCAKERMVLPGGGITLTNCQEVIQKWGVRRLHVGTSVRQGKYGRVERESMMELRKIVENV
jgi:copper homeostasis protein CutC